MRIPAATKSATLRSTSSLNYIATKGHQQDERGAEHDHHRCPPGAAAGLPSPGEVGRQAAGHPARDAEGDACGLRRDARGTGGSFDLAGAGLLGRAASLSGVLVQSPARPALGRRRVLSARAEHPELLEPTEGLVENV
jgi:hypothetical protein